MFDKSDQSRYTNYWMLLKDSSGAVNGVIGMQVDITNVYDSLIPTALMEAPYMLSYIALYNKEVQRFWDWGCRDRDCDG